MNLVEVMVATPAARARAIETVVAAFAADPAFRFFFQDDASFDDQAATFAGYLFDRRVLRDAVRIVDGGASVAMWDAPSPPRGDSRVETPPLDLPTDTLARLDAYEAAVHPALPTSPHWYLGVLATHPNFAGRRWGRAVMAAGLRRAAADDLPAYLETTNPYNVDVYRRAGWEVTTSMGFETINVWIMSYAGRPPSRDLLPQEERGRR